MRRAAPRGYGSPRVVGTAASRRPACEGSLPETVASGLVWKSATPARRRSITVPYGPATLKPRSTNGRKTGLLPAIPSVKRNVIVKVWVGGVPGRGKISR
jgi:hypothetical protein